MKKQKKPSFTGKLKCLHCKNIAPMEIVAHHSEVKSESAEDASGNDWPYDAGPVFELLKCPACDNISISRFFYHSEIEQEGSDREFIYPSHEKTPTGLPTKVAKAYEAALRVKTVDPNAYGVLMGRLLEIVCDSHNASGKTLNEKLDDLRKRGELPDKLVQVAHKARGFRNISAHTELGSLAISDIPILEDLTKAILTYLYTLPSLIKRAEKALSRLAKARARKSPPKKKT